MLATLRGEPKFVQQILKHKKLQVNCVDMSSMTAIHYALLGQNSLEKLKLLSKRKDTDFNIKCQEVTFIAWVAFSKLKQNTKAEIIKLLLTSPLVELELALEDAQYLLNLANEWEDQWKANK